MNEMIERVARALCTADGIDPDADWRVASNGLTLDVIDDHPQNWNLYVEKARFAIKAMREPTEEMKNIKDKWGDIDNRWDDTCHMCGGPKENWYRMIDAALGKDEALK